MNLLGSNKSKITKDENVENVPHLQITEGILVHCNIVNNDYQQDSRVLYTFLPNKSFSIVTYFAQEFYILKILYLDSILIFVFLILYFQSSKPLDVDHKINIILVKA